MPYAVFMMAGPGDVEARRLRTVVASLARHEPAVPLLVVVNDTAGPLPALTDLLPASCELVELKKTRPPSLHEIARNTLQALRYLATRDDVAFAVKIDTDALVIGPFADRIKTYFDAHPDVGQVGRAETNCDGTATDFGVYRKFVPRLKRRVQIWRSPTWGVAQAFVGDHAFVRQLVLRAAAHGVDHGRHCQGGAYAVSGEALRRLRDGGVIADDRAARVFGLAEDLMVSTLVASTGRKLASLTAPGEPFGVTATGLPMTPEALAAGGYGIIHSIKNDARVGEADVLNYFGAAL